MTGYDPSGRTIEWGHNDVAKIGRLLQHKRKLQKYTKIRSFRLAFRRLNEKISNLVDDCHKKFAKYLCSNYNYILIPRLSFHNFKKLNKVSKNKMIAWKHCSFVDRLIYKSREYNCKIIEVEEDYTSKTCTCCGTINDTLGSSREFNCNNCNMKFGRDINGARNILLKYITNCVSK
jgi:putative transposase